ncbi:lipocalin family protein [Psychroflexus planctonicus]|uniref:Lipocalin-like domain-containing protein n=1 Tax=Psychroflexus planctonicus TaxID=1526575 RepID=A0ABQ1SHZ4_9FLAO|nr:lipocalin family protein [Psychroflexus planctonicus]GGE40384.1 hypothetical protein GCM10010832_20670 [Psychroflexus planctonicus]
MKFFKLIFGLIFGCLTVLSCSSDDDSPAANDDVIIGEWRLIQIQENDTEIPLQECDNLEAYFFNEDFSFRAEIYEPVSGEEECTIANFSEGVWGKNSNNQYFTNTSGTNFPFVAQFSAEQTEMTIVIENPEAGIDERRTYQRQEIIEE